MKQGPYFEDVEEGMDLPDLEKNPTAVQLFYWSAVGWLAHRIHYDQEYVRSEGHPDVLVHGGLQGSFLGQLVTDWVGDTGRIVRLYWVNRARVVPGDKLTIGGKIVRKYLQDGEARVDLELWERNQEGRICVPGEASAVLPRREV